MTFSVKTFHCNANIDEEMFATIQEAIEFIEDCLVDNTTQDDYTYKLYELIQRDFFISYAKPKVELL